MAKACRVLGITLGGAIYVLSQVAFSRILYRRHTQGQLSDEEWERRRREPMYFTMPINYRPFLDHGWYKSGGALDVFCAISFNALSLPFMPTSTNTVDETGAPPFSALLSTARFMARAKTAQTQTVALLKHPLLHEFHLLRLDQKWRQRRGLTMALRAKQAGGEPNGLTTGPAESFESWMPGVITHGGGSLGDVCL